ncbi:DNA replication and repair protein RecF [Treponema sp. TIM-1]|uniref:DNA replication/repair protein RecF n=1 Tax=Treponema sp. TIM-1 TaxID=2898417 RepID=UPI0039805E50
MSVASLRITAFRNLVDAEIHTDGRDIFLVGENGQGKTNFLEALYFCSYASSFKGVRDRELIRNGEKDCSASIKIKNSVYEKVLVKLEGSKKSIQIDGKNITDRKELLEVAPCIVFCHEDMEFVAGSPERRRWFFDQSQSLYDPLYLEDLRKYRRVLKTRNTLLKENYGNRDIKAVLDALDPQLALYGLQLMEKRAESAEQFSVTFGPLYEEVSGINAITVGYVPSWKAATLEGITAFLEKRREADMAAGACLSGPHRDRYVFTRDGEEFSGKASTGQRRLLALLLRIAQARRFSQVTGKNPVLLLDDVLLELDPEKRRKFLLVMPEYEQAFYTFLPEEPYDRYRKSHTVVYTMSGGVLTT